MIRYSILIVFLIFLTHQKANASEADILAGKSIYQSNCANICHQAPSVGRLRPNQWRVVLNTMQTRMQSAGMLPLTNLQRQQVFAYLTQEKQQ